MLSKSSDSNKKSKKERRFSQQTLYEQFIAEASSPKPKPKPKPKSKSKISTSSRSLSNSAPPIFEAAQSSTKSVSRRWFRSKPAPPTPLSPQIHPFRDLNINQCISPNTATFLPSPKAINMIAEQLSDRDLGSFRRTCKYVYMVTYEMAKARKVQKAKVWLQEKPDEVWMNAISHDEVALLEYLNVHQRAAFNIRLVEQAILLSKVEAIKWMMLNYPEMFHPQYRHFETAASNGLIHVVKLFHKLIPGSCSEEGVNMAAYNGHVKVVKYIGGKHSSFITETTFTLAAMNGQKKVVKHLFFSYNSRFNHTSFISAMRALALRNGHRKVDSFLRNVKVAEDVAVTTAVVVGTVALGAVFCSIS